MPSKARHNAENILKKKKSAYERLKTFNKDHKPDSFEILALQIQNYDDIVKECRAKKK